VIGGWTEALQRMVEGDTWELCIPAPLAYGDAGAPGTPIRAGDALVFELEVKKIRGATRPAQRASGSAAFGRTTIGASASAPLDATRSYVLPSGDVPTPTASVALVDAAASAPLMRAVLSNDALFELD